MARRVRGGRRWSPARPRHERGPAGGAGTRPPCSDLLLAAGAQVDRDGGYVFGAVACGSGGTETAQVDAGLVEPGPDVGAEGEDQVEVLGGEVDSHCRGCTLGVFEGATPVL